MRDTCLATASQDGTVKYFDINNPRRAEKIITTTSPVWRARYTVKHIFIYSFSVYLKNKICFSQLAMDWSAL